MTDTQLILQWSFAVLVGGVLLWRRRLTLFHPAAIYLGFHVIFFCIRPLVLHAWEFDSMWKRLGFTPATEHLEQALVVSSAGLLAFVAVYLLTSRTATSETPAPPALDQPQVRALAVTVGVFAPLGLYFVTSGILDWAHANHSGIVRPDAYAGDPRLVLLPLALLSALAAQGRWWGFLPLIACATVRSEIPGDSWSVGLGFLLLLLTWLWSRGRRSFTFMGSMGAAALLVVGFVGMQDRDVLRDWFLGTESGPSSAFEHPLSERLDGPGFAALDTLTFVVAVVPEKSATFSHAAQHAVPPTAAGLSHILAGKPLDPTAQPIDLNQYGRFKSLPISLVADGWISGGWVGVVVTLGLLGALTGIASSIFSRSAAGEIAVQAWFLINLATLPQFLRDAASPMMAQLLLTGAPLLFWNILANKIRRSRDAAEERDALRDKRERRRVLGHAVISTNAAEIPPDEERVSSAEATPAEGSGTSATLPSAPSPTQDTTRSSARWHN